MENPISTLKEVVKDPVELTSITLPSAALVATFFAYRESIHPALRDLPDPLSANPFGGLLFLVVTLLTSLIVKRISHDLLNWTYDTFYRDRKRRRTSDTHYARAKRGGLLSDDPLKSQFADALEQLRKLKHPTLPEIGLLQTQSKLARSVSLVLLLFAVVLSVRFSWLVACICFILSLYLWYTFCGFRWEASELVYKYIVEQVGPANGSQPIRSETDSTSSAADSRR
jgi:hypothetical protein